MKLSPLEEQQLGGLIMWVPAGLLFTTYAMVAFGLWLHRFEAPPHTGRAAASAALEDEREAWGHLVQPRRAGNCIRAVTTALTNILTSDRAIPSMR